MGFMDVTFRVSPSGFRVLRNRETAGQVTVKRGPVVALLTVLLAIVVTSVTPRVRQYLTTQKRESEIEGTSAAGELKDSLRIAGDPWSGYFAFRSEKFRSLLMASSIRYKYVTELDLGRRFEGLAKGEFDMVVATIDGYTANGWKEDYPGVITWVIDESYGGDAIVGCPKIKTLDDLDTLPELPRIAFAEGYPSEHLLGAMVTQFKKKVKPCPVVDSKAALAELKSGRVDAAVLWEPETTNSQKEIKGAKVLISTRDMVEFIVDVVIVSRKLVASKPALVEEVARDYFSTLKFFQRDPGRFEEAIAADAGVTIETAQKITQGIRFVNLPDNAVRWFGVGGADATEKLSRIVGETVEIQKAQGRVIPKPLKDPFTIINRSILERTMRGEEGPLSKKFVVPTKTAEPTPKEVVTYRPASDQEWEQAEKVGTLDVAPIYFSSGSTELAKEDREFIDEVARKMTHYPRLRLKVVGHTSPGGDLAASRALSEERAKVVADYLTQTHSVPKTRVLALGKGQSTPLSRRPGESTRSFHARCQRVEFILVSL